MATTPPARKKLSLKAPLVPTAQTSAVPPKRGIRKRGGPPVKYLAPPTTVVPKAAPAARGKTLEDRHGIGATSVSKNARAPRGMHPTERTTGATRTDHLADRHVPVASPGRWATVRKRGPITTQGVQTFFATCPRGLEQVLRDELLALRVQGIETTPGGALFKASFRTGLEVNLESRVASRVLWKLAAAPYRDEDDVFRLARSIQWPSAFSVDQTIKVHTTAIDSPLTSIDYISLRVKDAICDVYRETVGARPNVDTSTPNQRIHVFLARSEATIYLDVSGEALFKRGYRRDGLLAPIRENLAAGILRLLKWNPDTPLMDPMCGSGTFITEGLLIASNAAPGLRRKNAHERWTIHPVDEFEAMKEAARARIRVPENLRLYARDASEEAVRQTRAHVAALGGTHVLDFATCSALELTAPCERGFLIANPPYGVRLGHVEDLAQMYPKFARILMHSFAGWDKHFITADLTMPKGLGMKPAKEWKLKNGALDCRLFAFPPSKGSA